MQLKDFLIAMQSLPYRIFFFEISVVCFFVNLKKWLFNIGIGLIFSSTTSLCFSLIDSIEREKISWELSKELANSDFYNPFSVTKELASHLVKYSQKRKRKKRKFKRNDCLLSLWRANPFFALLFIFLFTPDSLSLVWPTSFINYLLLNVNWC